MLYRLSFIFAVRIVWLHSCIIYLTGSHSNKISLLYLSTCNNIKLNNIMNFCCRIFHAGLNIPSHFIHQKWNPSATWWHALCVLKPTARWQPFTVWNRHFEWGASECKFIKLSIGCGSLKGRSLCTGLSPYIDRQVIHFSLTWRFPAAVMIASVTSDCHLGLANFSWRWAQPVHTKDRKAMHSCMQPESFSQDRSGRRAREQWGWGQMYLALQCIFILQHKLRTMRGCSAMWHSNLSLTNKCSH